MLIFDIVRLTIIKLQAFICRYCSVPFLVRSTVPLTCVCLAIPVFLNGFYLLCWHNSLILHKVLAAVATPEFTKNTPSPHDSSSWYVHISAFLPQAIVSRICYTYVDYIFPLCLHVQNCPLNENRVTYKAGFGTAKISRFSLINETKNKPCIYKIVKTVAVNVPMLYARKSDTAL